MESLNVANLLDLRARLDPERTFFTASGEARTFSQVEADSQRFAGALAEMGVQPRQRVVLMLPNTADFPTAYYGALNLGAVPVPINVTSPSPEVAYYLADSDAVALVAAEGVLPAALEGFAQVGTCRHLIVAGEGAPPARAHRLRDLLGRARPLGEIARTGAAEEAVILYTAGTTGRPRGVVLTHFNYYFSANFISRDFWRVGPEDVILMVSPAAHIFGQMLLSAALVTRARLSLLPRFEPEAFLRTIQQDRVTFFAGVPTLAHLMLHSPQVENFDLSSLRAVMFSGAPLHPQVAEQFRKRFGVELSTGYGMTEGVPFTFLTGDRFDSAPPGSVGLPALNTEIRIVDEGDQPVAAEQLGEIVVRGPQVFQSYLNRPEETTAAMRSGWFHTGDIGRLDAQGHLYIVDRLKDMIKRSGYAVSPAEVERVLAAHPSVAESAVVGVFDAKVGEEVKAFVVLRPGARATAEELIAHCKTQLAAYKYPRLVEFREALPKNAAGKVLRRALRDPA
ncbi:MAG: AMP-binding protein [Anaerolineales bacterium]|jgi:long-chain acyl-CoA synthetase